MNFFRKNLDKTSLYDKILSILKSGKLETLLNRIFVNGIEKCQCDSHKDPCNGPASIIVLRKEKRLKICSKCFEKTDTLLETIQFKKKEQIESLIIWEAISPNLSYIIQNQDMLK